MVFCDMSNMPEAGSQNGNGNHLPVNISEHLRNQQELHPEATGALTSILADMTRVAKRISYLVNTAGLTDAFGYTGKTNAQGEQVIRLDERANEQFKNVLKNNHHVAGYASEEENSFVSFLPGVERKYVVWFDPLDGSSNFDTNVSIGSIFSIYRRVTDVNGPVEERDFLQKGSEQVCSGYFLYGTSTMFVYTTGDGVYGFTLDPSVGEFVLPESYSKIQIPERGMIYSVNEANSENWSARVKEYIHELKTRKEDPCSARYVGSLVADAHRNMLKGGVYLYPSDKKYPNGKLRVNCELNPLSFVTEQTGGKSINENGLRIMDIQPRTLHERSSVVIGSRREVELFSSFDPEYFIK
ncbi:MAG: class 1 fructose-bisphosphatase [Candidatus Shapirobacteria bacterium]|jgi:fructose-1,6-bisphosphatase I